MMEPRIQYAKTSDGVSIAYYSVGTGSPLIWVPLGPTSHTAYAWRVPELRQLLEHIASVARLVVYDARGFGLSDRGQMDYSCQAMLLDLDAVATAAGLEMFTLMTQSHMAVPAITYAARQPDRVLALVLFNGVARGVDVSARLRGVLELARDDWELAKGLFAQDNAPGYALTTTLQQRRESLELASTQEAFLAFFSAVEDWDASELLADVATPTLVTQTAPEGLLNPHEASRRLAASLANASFASLAQGETGFEAGFRLVNDFLRGVLPRRRRTPPDHPPPSGTAIILFADIVDSTALTERLGDAAFRDKARDLDNALRAIIREHTGTPIEGKLLGDGVLAVFASARQAIAAALACGKAGEDGGLALHLGLHAGDVIREDNNVYGGAVNIAARISGLSAPGEVLVSDTVRSLARTSAGVSFEDRGEQVLKGVGEPVRVWVVRKAE